MNQTTSVPVVMPETPNIPLESAISTDVKSVVDIGEGDDSAQSSPEDNAKLLKALQVERDARRQAEKRLREIEGAARAAAIQALRDDTMECLKSHGRNPDLVKMFPASMTLEDRQSLIRALVVTPENIRSAKRTCMPACNHLEHEPVSISSIPTFAASKKGYIFP